MRGVLVFAVVHDDVGQPAAVGILLGPVQGVVGRAVRRGVVRQGGPAGAARALPPEVREHPEVQEEALAVLGLVGAVLGRADPDAVPDKIDHVELIRAAAHQRFQVAPVAGAGEVGFFLLRDHHAVVHQVLELNGPELVRPLHGDFLNCDHRMPPLGELLRPRDLRRVFLGERTTAAPAPAPAGAGIFLRPRIFAAFSSAKRLRQHPPPRQRGWVFSYAPRIFAAFSSANCLLYRSW